MGLVSRPTKTGGNTTYVAEVAAGFTTIKASEVDADLNAIITGGVNNIETANINAAGLDTAAFADLAVTGGKLAVGAAVSGLQTVATGAFSTGGTTENTIATLPSITVRGSKVLLGATIPGTIALSSTDPNPEVVNVTFRLKRDGATIFTWVFTSVNLQAAGTGGAVSAQYPMPAGFSYVDDSPAAGAHIYTLTMQMAKTFGTSGAVAVTAGFAFAMELS